MVFFNPPMKKTSYFQRQQERPWFDLYKGIYRSATIIYFTLPVLVLYILNCIFLPFCSRLGILNLFLMSFLLFGFFLLFSLGFFNSKIVSLVEILYVYFFILISLAFIIWNSIYLSTTNCHREAPWSVFIFSLNILNMIFACFNIICCPCITFTSLFQLAQNFGFWSTKGIDSVPQVNRNSEPTVFYDQTDMSELSEMPTPLPGKKGDEIGRNEELLD